MKSAQQELMRGFQGMLGRTLRIGNDLPDGSVILIGPWSDVQSPLPQVHPSHELQAEGFWLKDVRAHGRRILLVAGANDRGVLYGAFALLGKITRGESLSDIDDIEQPYAPIRWVNQWDNLDGVVERGYAGPSIFFADGKVREDLARAGKYARLLASVGINGCTINNVNANPKVLDEAFITQVARIADAFRPWGVRLSLSVDLSTPKALGDLDTFDPLDPRVADWWRKKVDEIYRHIPDLADSSSKPIRRAVPARRRMAALTPTPPT